MQNAQREMTIPFSFCILHSAFEGLSFPRALLHRGVSIDGESAAFLDASVGPSNPPAHRFGGVSGAGDPPRIVPRGVASIRSHPPPQRTGFPDDLDAGAKHIPATFSHEPKADPVCAVSDVIDEHPSWSVVILDP